VTPRTIILIFAALLTAGGTIYFAQSWLSRERAQIEAMKKKPVKEEGEQILVAKKNLPTGVFLKPEDVDWRPWPKEGLAPSYYLKGKVEKTALIGAIVRRGITAGEPISDGKIAKPGDQGFLAAVLDPGMRAITVSINQTSGIAGFVFPGDRVDLLLTAEIPDTDGSGQKRFAAETVLTKIRVLAMDQRVNDIENTPKVSKTITVEVTPKQAEMIAVAGHLGNLSLTLRSLAQEERPKESKDAPAMAVAGTAEDDLTKPKDADALSKDGDKQAKDAEKPAKDADKRKPDVSVAADSVERQPPERGTSVTFDSETSRLVGPRSDNNQVIVIRGAKSEAVKTGAGSSPTKPAGAADDSESNEGTSEAAPGSESNAGTTGTVAPTNSNAAGAVGTARKSATDLLKRGRL
jgi:pilus assembly protein CpaB